ncbi:MAG TPA: hypothetical protein DCF63_16935, partial [Planctomycetaceae bacterium]|nr:hypothetical protein [Planctomycetaceae bacterium]
MRLRLTATVGLILAAGSALVAQQNTPNVIRHDQQLQQYRQMIDRGIEYLRLRGQAADGSFSGKSGIGPTAL